MKNKLNNKFSGLTLTGAALTCLAAGNTVLLIMNKLIPMFNGSLQAEMLPGVEGGVLTFIMAVLGAACLVYGISYLLMAILGVNAIRFAKKPESVKARIGLGKFLVFTGVVAVISGITSLGDAVTFADKFLYMFPGIAQLVFVSIYLVQTKAIKAETEMIYS